jgi:hypothetical protein
MAKAVKKKAAKKVGKKKTSKKSASAKKNKLGVENSLVNNINARKKKGITRSKKKSKISKKSYDKMEHNWEKKRSEHPQKIYR